MWLAVERLILRLIGQWIKILRIGRVKKGRHKGNMRKSIRIVQNLEKKKQQLVMSPTLVQQPHLNVSLHQIEEEKEALPLLALTCSSSLELA